MTLAAGPLRSVAASRFASLVLVALAVWAGLAVLPRRASPDQAMALAFAVPQNISLSPDSPVFILDDQLFSHQCGRFLAPAGQPMRLFPYGEAPCQTAAATAIAVVYPADIRLLWALLTTEERNEFSSSLRDTSYWLRQSLTAAIGKSFFEEYRPMVRAILQNALERSLAQPQVREAIERALRTVSPHDVDRVLAGVVPVALERVETNLWNNVRGWFSPGSEPVGAGQIMAGILSDPRVRNHLYATLPSVLSNPAMADAAVLATAEFVAAAIDDPRLPQLLQHLLTDRRLTQGLGHGALPEGMPRKLLKLRSPTDHNPLSAYVLRLAMHGHGGSVALLLSQAQYSRVSALAGRGAVLTTVKQP